MKLDGYESVLRDLALPPRPEIVTILFEEMSSDDPDLPRITKHITADVALSAGMLRAANSPLFGLARKISSVPQAVSILGLRHVANIATGLAIRYTLSAGDKGRSFERFWDTAEKTALICHYLAEKVGGIPADEAYTFGLFHDCGIPVLIQRFPRYEDTLKRANEASGVAFTKVEEVETGTSHCILGYFLARSWLLSDEMCQAILLHHELKALEDPATAGAVRNLIGIGQLAEHVQHLTMRSSEDIEWDKFEAAVMRHFALSGEDLINLVDGAQAIIGAG